MFLSAGKQLSGQEKFQLEINKIDFVMKKFLYTCLKIICFIIFDTQLNKDTGL